MNAEFKESLILQWGAALVAQAESLYADAEELMLVKLRRGDQQIRIDAITSEVATRWKRKIKNEVRPILARMLLHAYPGLRGKMVTKNFSRGKNKSLAIALDKLNVVAVVVRDAKDPNKTMVVELGDVVAVVERLKAGGAQ